MYLLDANVVSELRRPRPHGAVLAWLARIPEQSIKVSAVTVFEIQTGIERTRDRDPIRTAELEIWLDQIMRDFTIVPMDAKAFRQASRLIHRRDRSMTEDAMIAATAQVHNLTVATRNTRDFDQLGVPTIDPFAA